MVDGRLLLLVVFAIFQPIISDQSFVDGKETCCIQLPKSIQSETKFSTNGLDRFVKTPEERRLNVRANTRDFDTHPNYRHSTRQTLEGISPNRDNRLQHRDRVYHINSDRRISQSRDSEERVVRSIYAAQSDIPQSSRRERVLGHTSRSTLEESQPSVDRAIYSTRNTFVQRLNNNRERRVMNVRDRRDRFEHNFVQRLNGGQENRSVRNNRDEFDEHKERRIRQSLARKRENLNVAHIEQVRSRSEEYRCDITALSPNERQKRVLTHRNDDLRSSQLREHSKERLHENRIDRVRDNSLSRNIDMNFATREDREFNTNDERRATVNGREVSENKNQLNRMSRSVSRNIETTRNRYQTERARNVDYSKDMLLERTIHYGERSNDIRRFVVENARNRDETRIHSKLNLRDSIRDRDTQVKSQDVNRNFRNREIIRMTNEKNEQRFQREQEVRDEYQKETGKLDHDYRRVTDSSDNRPRLVLRESNVMQRELSSHRPSVREQTQHTRNNIRNRELQSTHRLQERTETRQMNRHQSTFEHIYSTAPNNYKNAERQQSRQDFGFNRNTNTILKPENNGFEMKLHHLFYIIQGLYLISILVNMPVKDKERSKKDGLGSWLATRTALKID